MVFFILNLSLNLVFLKLLMWFGYLLINVLGCRYSSVKGSFVNGFDKEIKVYDCFVLLV